MQEPQRKGLKDLFKKIVKKVSDTEKTIHGNMGRDAMDAADNLGERLPRFLKPDSDDVNPKDMAKAMEIWRTQGMGKIGNQPNSGKGYRHPDYYTSDHLDKMAKKNRDYVTKPSNDEYIVEDNYTAMKYSAFAKKMLENQKPIMLNRLPPSKGEIAAGRAITTGAALGTGAAKAHSYWTDKKNEKK